PISFIIDFLSSAIMWVVFIGVFVIIPNTKVHLKNAVVSGIICGSAFQLVQYLFVTGQIYVTNYNAIYGSFAFLPLFLIFVQLSWLICLSGAVTTYSSQNVYHFNYVDDIDNISPSYLHEITVIIFAAIASRFSRNMQAFTQIELTKELGIPVKMVQNAINRLIDTKLVLESAPRDEETRYSPSGSLEKMTLNKVSEILRNTGESDFVPEISENFATEIEQIRKLRAQHLSNGDILIKDLLTESNRK
ncbi:MAG: YihY/virulence factor BrkB family protein, partial [Muribaculaceae bacterium]|nr:YihY/virulence factor BrkB family protein [Muribaculaceae bacterium]